MKEKMTNISLTQSRLIILMKEVYKQSTGTEDFNIRENIGICSVLMLHFFEDATEHELFTEVLKDVSDKLSSLSYSDVGEITLKDIIVLKNEYYKIFALLNERFRVCMENNEIQVFDAFISEVIFACGFWVMLHCNENVVKEFLNKIEAAIEFVELEDGTIKALY